MAADWPQYRALRPVEYIRWDRFARHADAIRLLWIMKTSAVSIFRYALCFIKCCRRCGLINCSLHMFSVDALM